MWCWSGVDDLIQQKRMSMSINGDDDEKQQLLGSSRMMGDDGGEGYGGVVVDHDDVGDVISEKMKAKDDAESTGSSGSDDSDESLKQPMMATLSTLLKLARPELPHYIFAILIISASGLAFQTANGLLADLINATQAPEDKRYGLLWASAEQIGILFGAFVFLDAFGGYIFDVGGETFATRLRVKIFESVMSQEMGYFDSVKTGELVSRLNTDTSAVQSSLTSQVSWFASNLAFTISGLYSL
eukprot:TRINITY_DN6504_c0_g1_i8.p1 TRINITY_DN6504_c0_g1~~TRINITY_DN6504_c0_g1_i8.p1  ORF type:complete len:242 (+),score=85.02 TRINITY_DN6504_c0_g1_i8:394-1119(+)